MHCSCADGVLEWSGYGHQRHLHRVFAANVHTYLCGCDTVLQKRMKGGILSPCVDTDSIMHTFANIE